MKRVERSIDIKASLKEVWRLVSTQEGMRQWINPGMQIDPRVGGTYQVPGPEGDQLICGTVLEIIPLQAITLSWYEADSDWAQPTTVTFRLEETPEGVRVHVTHTGFEAVREQGWERTLEAYRQGWVRHRLLENLKARAEGTDVFAG